MKNLTLIVGIFILILFLYNCEKSRSIEQKKVAITPLGSFEAELQESIAVNLKRLYAIDVFILTQVELPKSAITTFKGKRYNASELLSFLKKKKLDSVDYIMGLTQEDICIDKMDENGKIKEPQSKYKDFGIFGLGMHPGPTCVVSTKRLKSNDESLYLERLYKVTAHELGHNLGLEHCTYSKKCLMRSAAEKLSTIDEEVLALCENCQQKLGINALNN